MTNKIIKTAILILLGALAYGEPDAAEIEPGIRELELDFDFEDIDFGLAGKEKILDLSVRLGFMLTTHNEIGPLVSYIRIDPDAGSSADGGTVGAFYRFNFSTASEIIVPFLGVDAELFIGDDSDFFDYSGTVSGGLRIMPSEAASVNLGVFYRKDVAASGFEDLKTYGLAVGISIFL